MIKIILNGTEAEIASENLYDFIAGEKKLIPENVVAELNYNIIKREFWKETKLKTNDRLEIVSFVGGG